MKKIFLILWALFLVAFPGKSQLTLERCRELAKENYPAIKKYGLIERTADIDLNDINKSWLPGLNVYAQGSLQNIVPNFPTALEDVLEQMGHKIKGLGKLQYKLGIDVSQTIWDGGESKAQREISQSRKEAEVNGLEVEMYALNQKVDDIFFAILLAKEQICQSKLTLELVEANLKLMQAMLKNGVAMRSDVDMVEAQALSLKQSIIQSESAMKSYRLLLSIYIGRNVEGENLVVPSDALPANFMSNRPELRLFDSNKNVLEALDRLTEVSLTPKIGIFAQVYYGYPGFDYFKSMMNRELSFNILAGLKVSWNIAPFYSKRNKRAKTNLEIENINIEREIFLFNTQLQTSAQLETLHGLKQIMLDDAQIIELRGNVRKAAESQLRNGIIDATALLSKINDESNARLTAKLHEIQYIREIYKIKNTLNR